MNARSKTSVAIRYVFGLIVLAVALLVGMKFLPDWAAIAVAFVVYLILSEIAEFVFAEVKGRKRKKEAV